MFWIFSLFHCLTVISMTCFRWNLVLYRMARAHPFVREKTLSHPSASSNPNPSWYNGWNWSWQSRLCDHPCQRGTPKWSRCFCARSPRLLFKTVDWNVHPISYAMKTLFPRVSSTLSTIASGYLALPIVSKSSNMALKMLTAHRYGSCPPLVIQHHGGRSIWRCQSHHR